jgi:hypothetical protein
MKSNQPLEWTGHHLFFSTPPQATCLPLKGSVRRIGKSEQKCPVKETASVGISRLYSQFRAKPANDGRNTIWQLVG